MNGYQSDEEDAVYPFAPSCIKGGAGSKKKKAKTVKQRQAAKARRDARTLIKMAEKLPHDVKKSGFYYNEDSGREVIEESRELGNQADNNITNNNKLALPNPVIKSHSVALQYSATAETGKKPKVYVRGLQMDYDNTQSPFVNATYLTNNNVTTGVLNQALRQGPMSIRKSKTSPRHRRAKKTA